MRFILFGLITVLLSCASEPLPTVKEDRIVPFYRRYKNKDRELIYIAANLNRNVSSETKKIVEETIRRFDPEVIVTNFLPEKSFELEKDFSACESREICSTVVWTCRLAKKRGIPCLSGSPYQTEIQKEFLRTNPGTTSNTVMFFYTYLALSKSKSVKKDPMEDIDSIIEENKIVLNLASDFDKHDFVRIYREKMNSTIIRIDPKNIKPDSSGNYIQKISQSIESTSNNLVLRKIEEEQTIHKRVMTVYDPEVFYAQENTILNHYSDHIP